MTVPVPKPPPRWWQYVRPGRLFCPAGHHIPNTFGVTEAGFIRCAHETDVNHRRDVEHGDGPRQRPVECGLWVFLLNIRGGGTVVAAVSLDEKRAMEHLSTPAELIEYLGIFHR